MKKLFVFAAMLLATCTALNAENTTKIGSKHRVDYGLTLGWAQHQLKWYSMGFIDINATESNFRTRVNIGLAERWFSRKVKTGMSPCAAVDFQYLLPLTDGFYLYPSAGIYGEHYAEDTGHKYLNNYGLEAGLGLEIQFTSWLGIFAEGNYQLLLTEAPDRLGARAGLALHF